MPDLWYGTRGPRDSSIAIVGEAWGREEDLQKQALVGPSGNELRRMLHEASGIELESCFLTNVAAIRPQDNEMWRLFDEHKGKKGQDFRGLYPSAFLVAERQRLLQQLAAVKPRVVIGLGNYPLWALTTVAGCGSATNTGRKIPTGIGVYRGSHLFVEAEGLRHDLPYLPIFHPAYILRDWASRRITVHDLKVRLRQALSGDWSMEPPPTIVEPTLDMVLDYLLGIGPGATIVGDCETFRGVMTCYGLKRRDAPALCIPFLRVDRGQVSNYWSEQEERRLYPALRSALGRAKHVGHNYIYDIQYLEHEFAFHVNAAYDTMTAQHLLFPGTPKALWYLSSLFCRHHTYWKDDNKEWAADGDMLRHWRYNAEDVARTEEIMLAQAPHIVEGPLAPLWAKERYKYDLCLRMMRRGVLINRVKRQELRNAVDREIALRAADLAQVCPPQWLGEQYTKSRVPWWTSPHQTMRLFYEQLGFPPAQHKKTKKPTSDTTALSHLSEKVPHFRRLFKTLEEFRSLRVIRDTFLEAPLDPDGRVRCAFNPAGAETFRLSSSTNVFGRGMNLQNIPQGGDD